MCIRDRETGERLGLPAEGAALKLVEDQVFRLGDELGRQLRTNGRGVQHDAKPPLDGFFHQRGKAGDLVLKHKNIPRRKLGQHAVYICRIHLEIGAAVQQNAVLPLLVHLNDRVPGGRGHSLQQGHIHTCLLYTSRCV